MGEYSLVERAQMFAAISIVACVVGMIVGMLSMLGVVVAAAFMGEKLPVGVSLMALVALFFAVSIIGDYVKKSIQTLRDTALDYDDPA